MFVFAKKELGGVGFFFFHLRLATVWPNFVPQEIW